MKIRLLLEREPFPAILCQTLRRHAEATGNGHIDVNWRLIPVWARGGNVRHNEWYCNSELNVIFSPRVDRAALQPTVNEFSTSPHPWRRNVQRYYVDAALHPSTARWFAQARLAIAPEWLDPRHQVIVPGNQKIRVLDYRHRRTTAIWKEGFPQTDFVREINGRKLAVQYAVRVPRLLKVNSADGWYEEEYVATTPLNRLSNPADRTRAAGDAWRQLKNLLCNSTEYIALEEYLDQLTQLIDERLNVLGWLSEAEKTTIARQVESIRAFVVASEPRRSIATAMTHGDFQPANIVVSPDTVWIIDWECFDRRQITYDIWTLATGARAPCGLADRIRNVIHDQANSPATSELLREAATSFTDLPMERQASLFVLEHLVSRLADDCNSIFPTGTGSTRSFLPTLSAWQRTVS